MKRAQTCPFAGTIFFLVPLSQPDENVHRNRAVYDYQTLEARFRSTDIEKAPGYMEEKEEERTINFPGSPRNSPSYSIPSLTERFERGMDF